MFQIGWRWTGCIFFLSLLLFYGVFAVQQLCYINSVNVKLNAYKMNTWCRIAKKGFTKLFIRYESIYVRFYNKKMAKFYEMFVTLEQKKKSIYYMGPHIAQLKMLLCIKFTFYSSFLIKKLFKWRFGFNSR